MDDSDITGLMARTVAEPIDAAFATNGSSVHRIAPESGVAAFHPGSAGPSDVVVTTSHGYVGARRGDARTGTPIDAHGAPLDMARLLRRWRPDGCVWYSHACCSGGIDRRSLFAECGTAWPTLGAALRRVTGAPRASDFAVRLLGARSPARAVIGHVEPTFSWTLQDQNGADRPAWELVEALYECLGRGEPLGFAMRSWYAGAAQAMVDAVNIRQGGGNGAVRARVDELRAHLVALDRLSTVILGDPAVRFAPVC